MVSERSISHNVRSSISLSPGDDAVLRVKDGQLRITNRTSGSTLTVDSGDELTASGDAELAVDPSAFEVEGGDRLEATVTGTEASLENESITDPVDVAEGVIRLSVNPRLQLFREPQSGQIRLFGTVLTELL